MNHIAKGTTMRHARTVALLALTLLLTASGAIAAGPTTPQTKPYAMVVLTNAKPGSDAAFNAWYSNRHVHDVVKIPGFVSAQRFRWAPTAGAEVPKFRYFAQYELQSNDVAASVAELYRRNGTPLLPSSDAMDPNVYFAVYEPITATLKSPQPLSMHAASKAYTMLVLTNPKPGREDEFNQWYTERHIHDVVNIPGFVSARRFRYAELPDTPPPKFRYFATYELHTDDLAASVAELFKRNGTPLLPASEAMAPEVYFAVYEKIGAEAQAKNVTFQPNSKE
jgi:hypothetical protein